jgi:hypothetical protein
MAFFNKNDFLNFFELIENKLSLDELPRMHMLKQENHEIPINIIIPSVSLIWVLSEVEEVSENWEKLSVHKFIENSILNTTW